MKSKKALIGLTLQVLALLGDFFYSREATVLLNEQENFTEQEN